MHFYICCKPPREAWETQPDGWDINEINATIVIIHFGFSTSSADLGFSSFSELQCCIINAQGWPHFCPHNGGSKSIRSVPLQVGWGGPHETSKGCRRLPPFTGKEPFQILTKLNGGMSALLWTCPCWGMILFGTWLEGRGLTKLCCPSHFAPGGRGD